ncbi:MAG TPA: hypothetical protein PLV92_09840, partial [Pirellulaceae bacterium]|nr:hypothetical protein [Pirellulaceae bacterium]
MFRIRAMEMELLETRNLLATDITNVATLDLTSTSSLVVELGGTAPGHSATNDSDGFDQINVSGHAQLAGSLQIALVNDFTPSPGDVFDVLNYGAADGRFETFAGLSYSGGVLLPLQTPSKLALIATPLPTAGITVQVDSVSMSNDLTTFFATGQGAVEVTGEISVLQQRLRGTFAFARTFEPDGSSAVTIGASNVTMSWAGDTGELVSLTDGYGSFVINSSGFAGKLGVTLSENVDDLDFSGTFSLAINSSSQAVDESLTIGGTPVELTLPAGPYVRVDGVGVNLGTPVAHFSGDVMLETTGSGDDREIVVGATNIQAFFGDDRGTVTTTDDLGVRFDNGQFFGLVEANGDVAFKARGAASLVGVADLTLSGVAFAQLNTTDDDVDRSITVGGAAYSLSVASGASRFGAEDVRLSVAGFVDLSGDFLFTKSVSGSNTTITAAATQIDGFLGVNHGQADEFGVSVSGASLGVLIESVDDAPSRFALRSSSGAVSLSGMSGVTLSGSLDVEVNRLGHAVDVHIPALDDSDIPLNFPTGDDVERLSGTAQLDFAGFSRMSGAVAIERTATGDTTKLLIGGAAISGLLGVDPDHTPSTGDESGVTVSDATFGAALFKTASSTSYAFDAHGTAGIVGVPGLTAAGTLAARANTTGAEVHETVSTSSGLVPINFNTADHVARFEGSVTLAASDFAEVSGSFAFEKSGDKITIGAVSVNAFVGSGGTTRTGVEVSGAQLGAVIFTTPGQPSVYALTASGAASLVGVPNLSLDGTLSVEINRSGREVDETISTPAGDVSLEFDSADDVTRVAGHAHFAVAGFVDVAGDFAIKKTTSGDTTQLRAGATNLQAFLGANFGQADEFGVK